MDTKVAPGIRASILQYTFSVRTNLCVLCVLRVRGPFAARHHPSYRAILGLAWYKPRQTNGPRLRGFFMPQGYFASSSLETEFQQVPLNRRASGAKCDIGLAPIFALTPVKWQKGRLHFPAASHTRLRTHGCFSRSGECIIPNWGGDYTLLPDQPATRIYVCS